ncbi:MAG TPA: YdcF family protein [Chitinophagaceae bacterium]
MFFVLSKILLFLLSPAFWILILLGLSFIIRNQGRKKLLRITAAILFIVFTNPFLFNVCVRAWQPRPKDIPAGKHYSAVILLGGMTMSDRYERNFFGPEADRFIQTTKLYHSGAVDKVLLTGGSPYLFRKVRLSEADHLKNELLAQGIPATDIIVENRSKNTYENAVYSKRLLDSLKLAPPYIVVTSALHVPRAAAVFKKAGVQAAFFPAAYRQIDHPRDIEDFIIPSTQLLSGWSTFLKEIVGLCIYRLTGRA